MSKNRKKRKAMTLPKTMTETISKGNAGESSTWHNNRKKELKNATKELKEQFYSKKGHEHIDPDLTYLNEDLLIADPVKVYDEKFGDAVKEFNDRQKRKDRMIGKGKAISADQKAQMLTVLNIALRLSSLTDDEKEKVFANKKFQKYIKNQKDFDKFKKDLIDYSSKKPSEIKHSLATMKQTPTYGEALYKKIQNSKQQQTTYEFIIQIGNARDFNEVDENNRLIASKDRIDPNGIWQKSKKVLEKYYEGFEERNPSLIPVNANIHMDEEGAPHLHLKAVPVADQSKMLQRGTKKKRRNGLALKPSLNGAFETLGFKRDPKDNRGQLKAWQSREFDELEKIMQEEMGVTRRKGVTNRIKNVQEYKKAKALESNALEHYHDLQKQIDEKNDEIENKRIELFNTDDNLKKVLDDMDKREQDKKDLADAKEKADKREKELDNRQTNLDKKEKDLTARETAIIKKEKEQKEKDAELTKRETAVKKIEQAIAKIPNKIKKFFKTYFTERAKVRGFNDSGASKYADDIVNNDKLDKSTQVKFDLESNDRASLKAFSKALPELGAVIPEASKIAENVSEYAKNKEEDKSKTVEYETRAGAVMREPDRATDHKDVEPDLTNEPDEPDLTDDL